MVSLDDKVRALAVTAGWKTPRPEQDGSYSFRLEDGLDLKLFSPDGRWCFFLADLCVLPEPGHERDSLLRKVTGLQAGICRERASVMALERQEDAVARGLDGERLILQSRVPVDEPQPLFERAVRDFLNDLAWWKKSLGDSPREELPSMFSMPGTFFGGVS
jgi:hypothetical protein